MGPDRMDVTREERRDWLDRRIPVWGVILLVLAILGQSAGLLLWGARVEASVKQNAADIIVVQQKLDATAELAETVARVDERTKTLVTTMNRIDTRLDNADVRR